MNTMMKKIVGCLGLIMSLALAAQAKICTWTNGVNDTTGWFSVAGNWTNNPAVPVSGDSLVFGPTTGTTLLTNDLTFTSCGTITFFSDAPAYTINGLAIANGGSVGGFTVNSANAQVINNNFTTLAQNAFNVTGTGNLTLGGACSRNGTWNPNLTMNGSGVLTLNGATAFNASYLTVNSGTVVLAKSGNGNVGAAITINSGGTVMLVSSNQVLKSLTMSAGAIFDLNGYDNGSMVSPNQSGFFQINGTGGLIVNSAVGTGTNTLQLGGENLSGSFGVFGGTIADGPSAKTALGLGYNCWNSVFQMLTGNNTYSGGTTFGPISQTSTYTGGSTLSISSMQNIGAAGSRNLAFSGPASFVAHSILLITGTGITNSSAFDSITFNTGTRVGFDIADPSNTFTLSQAVNSGTSSTFTKRGAGTLVLTGAATYTGATALQGGTLMVDYQAGGSLSSATAPAFSGGSTLKLLGKTSGTTAQTLGNLTLSSGGGNLLIDPNNGTSTTLTLGTLTVASSQGGLLMGKASGSGSGSVAIKTATSLSSISPRIVFTDGTANGYDYATTSGGSPFTLGAYTSASVLPTSGGGAANNYKMTGATTLTGNVAANTLKLTSSTGDLDLGANSLTVGSLLVTGNSAVQITGSGSIGNGVSDFVVHQYDSGGLTIGAVINGANFVKTGTDTLTLSGINTYTGATYVNGGKLAISANNQLGAVATGAALNLNNGTLSTTGSFALDNASANIRPITIGSGGGGIEVMSGTLTNSGAITANGQFIKSGSGMLVSTVANTFNTGGLTVNDGTMLFTAANTFNNRVTVNGGTLRFSLTGNKLYGGVTLNGGTLLLDAASTIYGGVTLNGGTLSLNNNSYVGSTPLTFAGGTLQVTGAQTDPSGLNIDWANFNGGFDIANAATVFTVTNAISGSGSLVKSGSGTLVLNGSNTYSDATTILNGTLQLGTNIITGSGFESPVTATYVVGAPTGWTSVKSTRVGVCKTTFTAVAPQEGAQAGWLQGVAGGGGDISQVINVPATGVVPLTFKAIGRSGTSGPAPLVLLTNGVQAASWTATAFSKTAWTNITINLNLSAGAHTLTFTNTAITDLSTCIDAVSLMYPVASLPTNTTLTIASGATLDLCRGGLTVKDLAGSGTIANLGSGQTLTVTGTNTFTGTISGSGALNVSSVISPAGPGVFGTNTVAQALTFNGIFEVDVATDGSSDQLVTQGTLDLTGATVSVVNEGGLSKDKRYVILKYDVAPTGSFSDSQLPRLWTTKNDEANKRILLVAKIGTMVSFL